MCESFSYQTSDPPLSKKLEILHHFRAFLNSIQSLDDIELDHSKSTNPSLHYLYYDPFLRHVHGQDATTFVKPDWIAHSLNFMSVYDEFYCGTALGTKARNLHCFFYQIRDQLNNFTFSNFFDSPVIDEDGTLHQAMRITQLFKKLKEEVEEGKDFVAQNMAPHSMSGEVDESESRRKDFLARFEARLCSDLQMQLMGMSMEFIRAELIEKAKETIDKAEWLLKNEPIQKTVLDEEPDTRETRCFQEFTGKRAVTGELPWESVMLLLFFRNLRAESVESRVWRHMQAEP